MKQFQKYKKRYLALKRGGEYNKNYIRGKDVAKYIFYNCLFNVPSGDNNIGAKAKSFKSRNEFYGLLHSLNEKYPFTLSILKFSSQQLLGLICLTISVICAPRS